jgi:Ca2+-binding EF-hand superfamily protein
MFRLFDTNKDGYITISEVEHIFQAANSLTGGHVDTNMARLLHPRDD